MKLFQKKRPESLNLLAHLCDYAKPITRISGIGSVVPDEVVDNEKLADWLDAPEKLKKVLPGLIDRVTMVKSRRRAAPEIFPTDLGVKAVLQALENAGRTVEDVDTLIYASTDMDFLEPATANVLQEKLGLRQVNAFDVSNACNSFLQAVNVSNSLISSGAARCVVVCASELGSHWVCKELKCKDELRVKMGGLTLGDAAAAVVLEPATGESGISEINLFSLGEYWPLCHVPEDTQWRKRSPRTINGWFYLDMKQLAHVVRPLSVKYFKQYRDYRKEHHGENDFKDSLARVIPHQISSRLILKIVESLHADPDIVAITADEYGNTASAAIPFTLHQTIKSGQLELGSGQEVMLFGAASGLGMGHIRLTM